MKNRVGCTVTDQHVRMKSSSNPEREREREREREKREMRDTLIEATETDTVVTR